MFRRGKPPKFCSKACTGEASKLVLSPHLIEVNSIPEPNSGCWLWEGITNSSGYGRCGKLAASRASYFAHKGEVKAGVVVRHTCDNRMCVNPSHLILGTPADNVRDAVDRQRHAHGSRNRNATLHERDIPVIRQRLAGGERRVDVAKSFGVGAQAIGHIASGRTWRLVRDAGVGG